MPKPPKPAHPGEAKSLGQDSGKLRLYEILYNLNPGLNRCWASYSNWKSSAWGTSHGKPYA